MTATPPTPPVAGGFQRWLRQGPLLGRLATVIVLIALIGLASWLLTDPSRSKFATVSLQVLTAVAGAALGGLLQASAAQREVQIQARNAARHLVQHILGIRATIVTVQEYRDALAVRGASPPKQVLDEHYSRIDGDLRVALANASAAIDGWDDLSPGETQRQLNALRSRDSTIGPPTQGAS